ncbi:DUF6236 family protein [Acinetobacter baumannii]|uniref:DUF6236 family protein n=1 Tax=Acinetobacter baumannii TaxID=470 RepID=UPI003891966F
MLKGVVIPRAKMEISNLNTLTIHSCYEFEDIAYFCLYWDKIATPSSRALSLQLPFEEQLVEYGILERLERVNLNNYIGADIAQNELWMFSTIAREKLQDSDNDWLVHHLTKEPIYRKKDTLMQDMLRVKITNLLPVPVQSEHNSLDDIINFKKRRADELNNLHYTLNALLERIYNSKVEVIQKQELSDFKKALEELDKTVKERFKIYRKGDLEIGLDLNPVNFLSLISSQNFMEVATNIFSIFSINKCFGVTLNQHARRNNMRLEYISSARSEYII